MKRKVFIPVAILVLAAAIALGIFLGGRIQPAKRVKEATPTPTARELQHPVKTVNVYHVVIEEGQPKIRPRRQEVPEGKDPIETAIRTLVEQGTSGDVSNPIPEGTRLLGFDLRNGLATINLSHEFIDNFRGGSTGEALVIGTILKTLGQFPEVRQVRILVEGKAIESLGHLDLSVPLDVNAVGTEFNQGN